MSEDTTGDNIKILPIMGAYHRPPAKLICENLAVGAKLYLEMEPTNQFDVNAIKIFIKFDDLPLTTVRAIDGEPLEKCGHSIDSLSDMGEIHLGYVPKEIAKILRGRGFERAEGEFATSSTGKEMVRFFDPSKGKPQLAEKYNLDGTQTGRFSTTNSHLEEMED